ncbi:MAG: hypothetical protein QGI60_04595 [archaeon]|jgi:hypothetical protein|nr:hypothetical protein [archaeon]
MGEKQLVGMLLLGMAIGTYLPPLPEPVSAINPFVGLIFLVLGVIMFIKG